MGKATFLLGMLTIFAQPAETTTQPLLTQHLLVAAALSWGVREHLREPQPPAYAGGRRGATVQQALGRRATRRGPDGPAPEEAPSLHVEVGCEVEEWIGDQMAASLARGTNDIYLRLWKRWEKWCSRRERSVYLWADKEEDRRGNEEELLAYVGFLGWRGLSGGTIKSHLFAIQTMHARAGIPDPVGGAARVWMVLEGLRKSSPAALRKLGVTPAMLRWIRKRLDLSGPALRPDRGGPGDGIRHVEFTMEDGGAKITERQKNDVVATEGL